MNKLIRTKLMDKIKQSNPDSEFSELEAEQLKNELKKKLVEEASEFLQADDTHETEELGDILEVIDTLFQLEYFRINDVNKVKNKKYAERGGFKEGIYWKK